jgi:hypothetical protein
MHIDSDFLFLEIDKLDIEDWEKEGLKKLVTAELAGKSSGQIREMLETQNGSDES